jgi:hsp70-interacting protein
MSANGQPFEWLGLLKWSLSYTDGTKNDQNISPMSAEDRAFLEEVMKHGIVNEADRMKVILSEITLYLDTLSASDQTVFLDEEKEEEIQSLMMELKDIVGLIDYAKMFAAMGGIQLLMGMSLEQSISPRLRATCMTALATLCQNNPTVQKTMFEQGIMTTLINLYFSQHPEEKQNSLDESYGVLRSRIVQAISAMVRGMDSAEEAFCLNDKARELIESGLGMLETSPRSPFILRKKTLFFLQALITSDSTNHSRIGLFQPAIQYIVNHYLHSDDEPDLELREMSLSFILRIFENNLGASLDRDTKLVIEDFASRRIGTFTQTDDELEQEELYLCQQIVRVMNSGDGSAMAESRTQMTASTVPMLLAASPDPSHKTIPQ